MDTNRHMTPESRFQAAVLGYSNHIFFPEIAGNHVDPDIVISSTGFLTSGLNNDVTGIKDNFALLRLLRWAKANGFYIYNPNAWNNMAVSRELTGKDKNWMYVMDSAVRRCKVMVQLLPFQDDGGDRCTVGLEYQMCQRYGKPVVFLQGAFAHVLEQTHGSLDATNKLSIGEHLCFIREYDVVFNIIGSAGSLQSKSIVHVSNSNKTTAGDVKVHYKLNVAGPFLRWPNSPYFNNFDMSLQGAPFFSFQPGAVIICESDQYEWTMDNFPSFQSFLNCNIGSFKRVPVPPYSACHEAASRLAVLATGSGAMRPNGSIAMAQGQGPNNKYRAVGRKSAPQISSSAAAPPDRNDLCLGDAVQVFCRSFDTWAVGVVTELVVNSFVLIEFEIDGLRCRKRLRVGCANPSIRTAVTEEHDPACVWQDHIAPVLSEAIEWVVSKVTKLWNSMTAHDVLSAEAVKTENADGQASAIAKFARRVVVGGLLQSVCTLVRTGEVDIRDVTLDMLATITAEEKDAIIDESMDAARSFVLSAAQSALTFTMRLKVIVKELMDINDEKPAEFLSCIEDWGSILKAIPLSQLTVANVVAIKLQHLQAYEEVRDDVVVLEEIVAARLPNLLNELD